MASVFKARINPQSNRPGNLKGVAGFKNQAELEPRKCRSESRTSYTFNFNRPSKTNATIVAICLGLWCLKFIMR